jgi:response regulator RpfG family c-di-GMP phosphodiesterase
MPTWLTLTLLALGAWFVIAAVLGFSLGRFFGAVETASATGEAVGGWVSSTPQREARHHHRPNAEGRRRILVVDDDAGLRLLLRTTLAADDFDVESVGSAEEAREAARLWRPEVILLDVGLPGKDGLTFCAELAREDPEALVILVTGESISQTTARMAGAKGVVRKPFSPLELLTLIDRVTDEAARFVAMEPSREDEQLLIYARDLARIASVERAQRQLLQQAYHQTATALADAVEARDRSTGLHAQRVREYALMLAEAVDPGLLQDPSLEYGFLLHDVGKIGIPDQILLKPGPLTDEERHQVQSHPTIGAQILGDVAMLRGAGLDVVRNHHERWDGAGYPNGLSGNAIPLGARIFSLGDTLDAMTSDRPYRDALSWDDAVEEILAQSGRQFDPSVVQAFTTLEPNLRRVYDGLSLVA